MSNKEEQEKAKEDTYLQGTILEVCRLALGTEITLFRLKFHRNNLRATSKELKEQEQEVEHQVEQEQEKGKRRKAKE